MIEFSDAERDMLLQAYDLLRDRIINRMDYQNLRYERAAALDVLHGLRWLLEPYETRVVITAKSPYIPNGDTADE